MHRQIVCIDLKTFYASCECIDRGLNPHKTSLVVTDIKRGGNSSITLAVTPYLKKLGVKSRCRVFELPRISNIIYVRPRMRFYLQKSMEILNIYYDFFSEEDIYVYSVDEVFIDLTPYLKLYNKSSVELIKMVISKIYEQTKLEACAGIGENMVIAKLALDIKAKKHKNSICYWSLQDFQDNLWPMKDLHKVWGIGFAMEKRLNSLGIKTIGELAIYDRNLMKKQLGIYGVSLIDKANGIDYDVISHSHHEILPKSIGQAQTLMTMYRKEEIPLLFKEMAEELCMKLRIKNIGAKTVQFFVSYDRKSNSKVFNKAFSLDFTTDSVEDIMEVINFFVHEYCLNYGIKKVGLSLTNLSYLKSKQLNLFYDVIENEKINQTRDLIRTKYGKNSLGYASKLLSHSTALKRSKLIGGHHE